MTMHEASSGASSEAARIAALHELEILDTAPEALFDDIAELASEICEAPIALVSLVDEQRQWFKARVGLDITETPRDVAFCAHAIRDDAIFVVPDTLQDPRFKENPLVTKAPEIRFYAGAPLRLRSGHAMGTLCILDRVPRQLGARARRFLSVLRHQVETSLTLRLAERVLRREGAVLCSVRSTVSVDTLFERLAADAAPAFAGASVTLRVLPSAIRVDADASLLQRVVETALADALLRAPSGSEVVLSARLRGDEAILRVDDQGRDHSAPSKGLPFCREAILAQGGRIWEETDEGGGRSFCIALIA